MNRAQDEGPPPPSRTGKPPGMKLGPAYQAALEATVAVVLAGAAGGYADRRFGTAPILLIVGVLLGFGTFVLRLVRLMNELARGETTDSASTDAEARDD
jgi:F0F1-type ATP synthase assembly protein I